MASPSNPESPSKSEHKTRLPAAEAFAGSEEPWSVCETEILRLQYTPYAFKQGQCQNDIDNPVMLYVEILYQKSGTNPS